MIIVHYCKENNNLLPARECLTHLVIKVWAWILKNKLEQKKSILNEFRKLIFIHFQMLNLYLQKSINVARTRDGLFSERNGPFEEVGYPMRCFDYLNYLVYFLHARKHWPQFENQVPPIKEKILGNLHKTLLMEILDNNDGCSRPLLDNHSIAILNTILYFLKDKNLTQTELNFIGGNYLVRIFNNLMMTKMIRGRLPELHNNSLVLTEYVSTKTRPYNYEDKSSMLITALFELVALFNAESIYKDFKGGIKGQVNLQTACPNFQEFDIEQLLFEKHFDREFYVEHSINLNDELNDFKKSIEEKGVDKIDYRTDKAGFSFLRILAHVYHENELFPNEWRELFTEGQLVKE